MIHSSLNMMQELLFYRIRPIPALRYFRNTVLMTGKSRLSMGLRQYPTLFRKRKKKLDDQPVPPLNEKEIYEASRGYF